MFDIYRLEATDTLSKVATLKNTTIDYLRKINGLTEDSKLYVGGYILVPTENRADKYYEMYTVKSGDTISSIARSKNMDYKILLMINGLNENDYIYPDQEILVPTEDTKFYMTEENDTIKTLSSKFGDKTDEILSQNDFIYVNPNQLIIYK